MILLFDFLWGFFMQTQFQEDIFICTSLEPQLNSYSYTVKLSSVFPDPLIFSLETEKYEEFCQI